MTSSTTTTISRKKNEDLDAFISRSILEIERQLTRVLDTKAISGIDFLKFRYDIRDKRVTVIVEDLEEANKYKSSGGKQK